MIVLIAGIEAGILSQQANGSLAFAYKDNYQGVPLSIAMPLANRIYDDKVVRPYLFGLLPDELSVRRDIANRYSVSANNPFALLTHIGFDCPGAVQICPASSLNTLFETSEELFPLTESAIAQRLREGRTKESASWINSHEHWSLGGAQSKFALRMIDEKWFSCGGSAATTHIFKPGIPSLIYQALNEYLCMKLARECGVSCAEVSYQFFEDEPAIIVKRYDRILLPSLNVVRIHQEDFCQALGILPENKYPQYGGPSSRDVVNVLSTLESRRVECLVKFTQMLFFNYLIGATDAHAKNFSLLYGVKEEITLAPLYDVASGFPYCGDNRTKLKLAMGIGGETVIGKVGKSALAAYSSMAACEEAGLDEAFCWDIMGQLAVKIPSALDKVLNKACEEKLHGAEELGERLMQPISRLCESMLSKSN